MIFLTNVGYYLRKIRTNIKYHAIWVPNTIITLGNYGYFENGNYFKIVGNIKAHGIKVRPLIPGPSANLEYHSKKGINISFDVDKLNVKISFGKDTALITKFADIMCHRIEYQPELRSGLINLWNNGVWEKEFWLITEVLTVKRIVVIIGRGSNDYLSLRASIPIKQFDPLDIGFGLQIRYKSDQVLCFTTTEIEGNELTPLFRISRLTKMGGWKGLEVGDINEKDLILEEFPYI